MPFVLDASAALPWCFRDEATPGTEALLSRAMALERIFVPAHWPTEMLGGLTRAARSGRVDPPTLADFLASIPQLLIEVDRLRMNEQWNECLPLIRTHRLSAYDAAYLALAKRLSLPLATLDDRLCQAALAEGVPLEI